MKDERGQENVSLLYSVACAQNICTCLNGHTPLLMHFSTVFDVFIYVFVCIVTTRLASCIISCLSSLYHCDNNYDN